MPYQVALNWSAVNSLANLNPQPKSPGILHGEAEVSSLGLAVVQGRPFTYWEFDILSLDQWDSVLAQLGLSDTVRSRKITCRTRDNARQFLTRNGYAQYPVIGQQAQREMVFWRRIRIPIIGLRVP